MVTKSQDALIAEIRAHINRGVDFYFIIETFDLLKRLYPEAQLPDDLSPVERHCRIGLSAYTSARRIYDQKSSNPPKTLMEQLFDDVKVDKIRAHCAASLKKDPQCAPALRALAQLDRRNKDLEAAILKLKEALAGEPGNAGVHYDLARLFALQDRKPDMIHHAGRAIHLGRNTGFYHTRILGDSDFKAYQQDPELRALCDRLPQDPDLRALYELMRNGLYYEAYQRGQQMMSAPGPRQVAALDAVEHSLRAIVTDLQEHGDANLELYGGEDQDPQFFSQELERISAYGKGLRTDDKKSAEYERFVALS